MSEKLRPVKGKPESSLCKTRGPCWAGHSKGLAESPSSFHGDASAAKGCLSPLKPELRMLLANLLSFLVSLPLFPPHPLVHRCRVLAFLPVLSSPFCLS